MSLSAGIVATLFLLPVVAGPPGKATGLSPECVAGDPDSCMSQGLLAKEPALKLAAFERACELGRRYGCTAAGELAKKENTAAGTKRSLALLEKACAMNHGDSCWWLGELLSRGDPSGHPQAFLALKRALDQGAKAAYTSLGHLHGKTQPPDNLRAALRYQQSCKTGDAAGCFFLADVLTKEDVKAAAYMHACKRGYEGACPLSRAMVERGVKPGKVPELLDPIQQLDAAMALMPSARSLDGAAKAPEKIPASCERNKHCLTGDLMVCQLEWSGRSTPSSASAYCAQQEACTRGYGPACRLLGERLLGKGPMALPEDPVRAAALFEKGCSARDAAACLAARDALARPELAVEAQARALRQQELTIRACALDHQSSCTSLLTPFLAGELPPALEEPAARALQRLVGEASSDRQHQSLLRDGRKAKTQAAELDKQCAAKKGPACAKLGARLETKNPEKARALLVKACDLGSCGACVTLAKGQAASAETITRGTKACQAECKRGSTPDDAPVAEKACGAWFKMTTLKEKGAERDRQTLVAAETWCTDGAECEAIASLYQVRPLSASEETRLKKLLTEACAVSNKNQNVPPPCMALELRPKLLPLIRACAAKKSDACAELARNTGEPGAAPAAAPAPPAAPAAATASPTATPTPAPTPVATAPLAPPPRPPLALTDTSATLTALPVVAAASKTPGPCLIFENGRTWATLTHFTYDPSGNVLRKLKRNVGKATYIDEIYSYDQRGKLLQLAVYYPGGSRLDNYTLDEAGRPTVVTEGTEYRIEHGYDTSGRHIRETSSNVATKKIVRDDKFAYDQNGRLSKRTGLDYEIDYTYDKDGRLVREVKPGGYSTTYRYNAAGNKIGSDQLDRNGKNSQHFEFTYDAHGNVLTVFEDVGDGFSSRSIHHHVCQGRTAIPAEAR